MFENWASSSTKAWVGLSRRHNSAQIYLHSHSVQVRALVLCEQIHILSLY
jgi:hypothetical protein